MSIVRQYLEQVASLRDPAAPAGWKHPSFERMVLDRGRGYARRATPEQMAEAGVEIGPQKMCFQNSAEAAMGNPDLTYVEGWALAIIPIHHAWCVDSSGLVYDPTWPDGTGSDYLGIPMQTQWLASHLARSRVYGVFDYTLPASQEILTSGTIRTAGPASNMVPFDTFPVRVPTRGTNVPRDVKVLRMAEKDIARLDRGQQRRVHEVIEDLKAGRAVVEEKDRPPLKRTYTVRVTRSLRLGLYLTDDQPGGDDYRDWVVYIITDHDYSEAERRMRFNARKAFT